MCSGVTTAVGIRRRRRRRLPSNVRSKRVDLGGGGGGDAEPTGDQRAWGIYMARLAHYGRPTGHNAIMRAPFNYCTFYARKSAHCINFPLMASSCLRPYVVLAKC